MKRRIRLTESDLHRVIKESVNKILNEEFDSSDWTVNEYDKHFLDGINVNDINNGYYDGDILDNWETFYEEMSSYWDGFWDLDEFQNAAKKRKQFLDLVSNKNFSRDWLNYFELDYNESDYPFYERIKDFIDDANKLKLDKFFDSQYEWDETINKINGYLNLIRTEKVRPPKYFEDDLEEVMNYGGCDFSHYKEDSIYRWILGTLAKIQKAKENRDFALRQSKMRRKKDNKRVRRFDNFLHKNMKNMDTQSLYRATSDNVRKHEFNGRNPDTQKLHTKNSANRDLIAMDRKKNQK